MGWRDGDVGPSYDYCNNRWICNGLGWEEKEMKSSTAFLIFVAGLIIITSLYRLNIINFELEVLLFLLLLISLAHLRRQEKLPYRELTDLIF